MFKIRNMAAFFAVFLMISLLPFTNLIGFRSYAVDSLEVEAGVMLPSGFNVLPDGNGNFFITSYDNTTDQSAIAYLDDSGIKNITASEKISYKYTSANYCFSDFKYIYFTQQGPPKMLITRTILHTVIAILHMGAIFSFALLISMKIK